jgi:hypothetical protein
VTETIEMNRSLEKRLDLPLGPFFLNQVEDAAFSAAERRKIEQAPSTPAVEILKLMNARADLSAEYAAKLDDEVRPRPVIRLPFVYSPQFGLEEIRLIAAAIRKQMEAGT